MRESEIVARLESLERQNRRWKAAAGALAVLGAAAVLLGAAEGPAEVLEARSLVVRAEEGGPVLRIGAAPDGRFGLRISDGAGKERLVAEFDAQQQPHLALSGADGRPRIQARFLTEETSGLFLNDGGEGKFRTWWMTTASGPFFDMFDRSGKTRLGLSVIDKAGSAGISLFDRKGAVRAGLIHQGNDAVRLTLQHGPEDKERDAAELKVGPTGAASLTLHDAAGKPTFTAPK